MPNTKTQAVVDDLGLFEEKPAAQSEPTPLELYVAVLRGQSGQKPQTASALKRIKKCLTVKQTRTGARLPLP